MDRGLPIGAVATSNPVNVVYVDHSSLVGGAQRALLALLRGLPAGLTPTLLCPAGPLAERTRELGAHVVTLPGSTGGFGLNPVTAHGRVRRSSRSHRS